MKQDWHGYARNLQTLGESLDKSELLQANKDFIRAFWRELAVTGISPPRILKYVGTLKLLGFVVRKPFVDWTRDDVTRAVESIESRPLSEWTKQSYRVVLKRFFKWLRNSEDEYPPEVRWIKTNVRRDRLSLPGDGDLLTAEEVQRLVRAADHPRDKAFVACLYESGCRIGEIATPRIKDVSFEKHGCRVIVTGKTGSRPVLLLNSVQYLATWLSMHPQRDNREAPLWVNIGNTKRGKQLRYGNVRKLLQRLFEKAGIGKRCNPHLFRHSRASHLAPHLSDQLLCKHLGWTPSSKMPAVYVHLNNSSVDDALRKLSGVAPAAPSESSQPKAKPCPRCGMVNPSDFAFCGKCGCGLDVKAVLEAEQKQKELEAKRTTSDNVLNALMQDAEVRDLLKRKLTTLNV